MNDSYSSSEPLTGNHTPRRPVRLYIDVDTNMSHAELGGLVEGALISLAEFGKEGVEMPRYEQVILNVLDGGFMPGRFGWT